MKDIVNKDIVLPIINVNAYQRNPSKFLKQEMSEECDTYLQKIYRTPPIKLPVTYADTYLTRNNKESPIEICLTPKRDWCTR